MLWERKARRVAVLNHARNLARSGRYAGWEAIQADTHAFSDLSGAERWFGDPAFRAQLNRLCELAREGQTGPRGPRGRRLQKVQPLNGPVQSHQVFTDPSAPSSLPGIVESGPCLTRTLVLRSGERLKTLRHATEMMGRLVGNARHSASLERAITLLLRAAEAETRDDRKAATNQVARVLRLNGLLQRTGGVRAVPTPPTGR